MPGSGYISHDVTGITNTPYFIIVHSLRVYHDSLVRIEKYKGCSEIIETIAIFSKRPNIIQNNLQSSSATYMGSWAKLSHCCL